MRSIRHLADIRRMGSSARGGARRSRLGRNVQLANSASADSSARRIRSCSSTCSAIPTAFFRHATWMSASKNGSRSPRRSCSSSSIVRSKRRERRASAQRLLEPRGRGSHRAGTHGTAALRNLPSRTRRRSRGSARAVHEQAEAARQKQCSGAGGSSWPRSGRHSPRDRRGIWATRSVASPARSRHRAEIRAPETSSAASGKLEGFGEGAKALMQGSPLWRRVEGRRFTALRISTQGEEQVRPRDRDASWRRGREAVIGRRWRHGARDHRAGGRTENSDACVRIPLPR